jgi:aminoglycoside 3-N-acetyltransferase
MDDDRDRDQAATRMLVRDLLDLGVCPGQDLLVHCSMRRVGQVRDGAAAVLRAVRVAAGPDATLVVPAQTAGNSLSSRAFATATAGLDAAELEQYIAQMPGFDPVLTPSAGMGVLAELVRTTPGAVRSAHPQSSFAALGPRAAQAMAGHELTCHLGDQSPLGWLYRAGAAILLLGAPYSACTAFHLAEYRLPWEPSYCRYVCFTSADGARRQHDFTDIELDDGDFGVLGSQIDSEPFVRRGTVRSAESRLLPFRSAVDFALSWPPFLERRRATAGSAGRGPAGHSTAR